MDQIHFSTCGFSSNIFCDKQVSSSELLSSNRINCPNSGRLRTKYQAKVAKTEPTNTRTRHKVVNNPRQSCDTFVASNHKRKSSSSPSFKYLMLSSLSLNSLSLAQSLALVTSCCIVATLSLNFANLISASNNFISANNIPTDERLMINKNHNHRYYHHHYHQQTSPANLRHRKFYSHNKHNPDLNRNSRPKTEQKNKINSHLFNDYHKQKFQTHNHNYHDKQESPSQQVPEQLPIVVSLSDNSYVSASPVESTAITATTNTANEHISPDKNKKHRTRYLLHHLSSSNSVSHRNNDVDDDTSVNHHHQQQYRLNQQKHHRQRPFMNVYDNDLFNNRPVYNDDDLQSNVEQNKNENEELKEEEDVSKEAQQLTSSSDISTTATTTQRNKEKNHNNLVQMYAFSDPEDQVQDETTKHGSLKAHYRIKPAAIIKTRESIDMGATFLNYTIVTNLNACLVECWITDSCDTAIYQESPVDFNNINIDHLPNSFAKSRENYSLTPLMKSSQVTQSTLLSNFIDESETIFNINDNDINKRDVGDNNDDIQEYPIGGDNETSGVDLENGNHNNDVDEQDDGKGKYNSNSDNKRSKITRYFETRLPENGFFICYLFECVKPDGFKCQFSAHNYYVSATKRRHNIDINAAFTTDPKIGSIEPAMSIVLDEPFVRNNVSDKTISSLSNETLTEEYNGRTTTVITTTLAQDYNCGQDKFKCMSQDQCIPSFHRCDGIVHCSDRSDEFGCRSSGKYHVKSNGDHTTLDGYSIVVSDGSIKSDQMLETIDSQASHSEDSLYDKVVSKYPTFDEKSKIDIRRIQKVTESKSELQTQKKNQILVDEVGNSEINGRTNVDLKESKSNDLEPRYSNIVTSHTNYNLINGRQRWHDSHIASIKMSQEEYDYGYQKRGNGMNSAIIAIIFGIGVTGMLVMIVGHKMKSIGRRIAYRGRRRSLVPDMDFLINTMPI